MDKLSNFLSDFQEKYNFREINFLKRHRSPPLANMEYLLCKHVDGCSFYTH